MTLSYEPRLLLAAGDAYSSEPQFIGIFSRASYTVTDHYLPALTRESPHMISAASLSRAIHLQLRRNSTRLAVAWYFHMFRREGIPVSDRLSVPERRQVMITAASICQSDSGAHAAVGHRRWRQR